MAKAARPARPRKPAAAPAGVTVRMYCQGLGDCFLLAFPAADGKKRCHVMIDCGVILGTPNAQAKMAQVAADIAATVKAANGSTAIDLLVVTHEHWDHVSGFVQVPDKFDESKAGALTFKNVWLAWTEKDGHPLAERIRADQKAKKQKLRAALTAAGPLLAADDTAADAVSAALGVLDFFGPMPGDQGALAAAGVPAKGDATTEAAMAWLKGRATKFCQPGEVAAVPNAAGVRAFVLGPPEDLKLLKRDAPRKGSEDAFELRRSLLGALGSPAFGGTDAPLAPFDDRYALTAEQAEADPFFRQTYGFADDPLGDAGRPWQRIESDWLLGAATLALKMDSDTNNTSLALAFELPGGDTLVFPGDAQMGNWESWAGVTFDLGGGKTVGGLDLLRRAVLYKVGHHGSHNATRKEGGLEEMTGGKLVAMIPVDEEMAKKKRPPKTGWKMPFGPLFTRLKELTGGRILRADRDAAALDAEGATAGPGWKAFRGRVGFAKAKLARDPKQERGAPDQPLYVEYVVPVS